MQTKLYLVDVRHLSQHLFYQLALRQFGAYTAIIFQEPIDILGIIRLGLDMPESFYQPSDGSKDELAQSILKTLVKHKDMLQVSRLCML